MTDQTPDIERVLELVRKLLNTKGRTPEEAAEYVAKAQALLQQYDLEMEDAVNVTADRRSSVREERGIEVARYGKPEGWKADLFRAVAETNDCYVVITDYGETVNGVYKRGTFARLVGRHSDIEMAHYVFDFLVGEMLRLSNEYGKERWQEIWDLAAERGISKHDAESIYVERTGTHPLRAKLSWLKGATRSVIMTLRRDKEARTAATRTDAPAGASTALVVVERKAADIKDFLDEQAAKRYGMTLEQYRAQQQAARERREAAVAAMRAEPPKPVKPETDAQRRKREEREERADARWREKYWREQERAARSTDRDALRRGEQDGARISIRPGVKPGTSDRGGELR
jgi:hypothetical protein